MISLRIDDELLMAVESRGTNRSEVIRRDLSRLYRLYERALLQVDLSVQEALLIVDALISAYSTADDAAMLWADVEDAIRLDRLDQKFGVDGEKLVEKLRGLSEIQAMALIDAAERFWIQKGDKPPEEVVRKVFMIR